LLTQAFLKPGLGASKPPKKKKKAAAKEVDQTVDRQTAKQASKPVAEDVDRTVMRPPALKCKKKLGTCNHKLVFEEHYNKAAWEEYAAYVKTRKSTTQIDPNYNP
jgi:hypothetical protein